MPRTGNRGTDLDMGETITLKASGAVGATAGTNGTAVYVGGERVVYYFYLDVTALATDATDTLDVYIDWSIDNSKWYNGAHFPQILGNGSAASHQAMFGPIASAATTTAVTADVAVGVVRPEMTAPYVRCRYVIVDPGAGAASFTFSVKGWAI